MTLREMIDRAIELKVGNKEFALFYAPGMGWEAHIGNPTNCVGLGEVPGEVFADSDSPEEALAILIAKLEASR